MRLCLILVWSENKEGRGTSLLSHEHPREWVSSDPRCQFTSSISPLVSSPSPSVIKDLVGQTESPNNPTRAVVDERMWCAVWWARCHFGFSIHTTCWRSCHIGWGWREPNQEETRRVANQNDLETSFVNKLWSSFFATFPNRLKRCPWPTAPRWRKEPSLCSCYKAFFIFTAIRPKMGTHQSSDSFFALVMVVESISKREKKKKKNEEEVVVSQQSTKYNKGGVRSLVDWVVPYTTKERDQEVASRAGQD